MIHATLIDAVFSCSRMNPNTVFRNVICVESAATRNFDDMMNERNVVKSVFLLDVFRTVVANYEVQQLGYWLTAESF